MATATQAVPGDAACASSLLFPADLSLAHPQNVQACLHAVKTGVPGVESGSTTDPVTAVGNEPAQQPPTLPFTPVDLSSAHQQAASQLRPAQLYAGAPGLERDNPQEPHEADVTASDIMCDLPAALLARRLGSDVPDDNPAASQHGPPAPPANLEPPATCHEPNLPPPLSHINWPNTPTASTAWRSPGNLSKAPCRDQHASRKVPPQQQTTPAVTPSQDQLAPTTPATSPAAPRKQLTSQHKDVVKKRDDPARSTTSSQDLQAGSSRSAALLKKRPSAQAISSNVAPTSDLKAFMDAAIAGGTAFCALDEGEWPSSSMDAASVARASVHELREAAVPQAALALPSTAFNRSQAAASRSRDARTVPPPAPYNLQPAAFWQQDADAVPRASAPQPQAGPIQPQVAANQGQASAAILQASAPQPQAGPTHPQVAANEQEAAFPRASAPQPQAAPGQPKVAAPRLDDAAAASQTAAALPQAVPDHCEVAAAQSHDAAAVPEEADPVPQADPDQPQDADAVPQAAAPQPQAAPNQPQAAANQPQAAAAVSTAASPELWVGSHQPGTAATVSPKATTATQAASTQPQAGTSQPQEDSNRPEAPPSQPQATATALPGAASHGQEEAAPQLAQQQSLEASARAEAALHRDAQAAGQWCAEDGVSDSPPSGKLCRCSSP